MMLVLLPAFSQLRYQVQGELIYPVMNVSSLSELCNRMRSYLIGTMKMMKQIHSVAKLKLDPLKTFNRLIVFAE